MIFRKIPAIITVIVGLLFFSFLGYGSITENVILNEESIENFSGNILDEEIVELIDAGGAESLSIGKEISTSSGGSSGSSSGNNNQEVAEREIVEEINKDGEDFYLSEGGNLHDDSLAYGPSYELLENVKPSTLFSAKANFPRYPNRTECNSTPTEGCSITQNLDIEPGHHIINSTLYIHEDNIYVDCHGATIEYPKSYALFYIKSYVNVTIRNCNLVATGFAISTRSCLCTNGTDTLNWQYYNGLSCASTDEECASQYGENWTSKEQDPSGWFHYENNSITGSAAFYTKNNQNVRIVNNSMTNMSSKYYILRLWNTKDSVVENNTFSGMRGSGMQIVYSDNITVRGNDHSFFWRYAAMLIYNSSNSLIEKNEVHMTTPTCSREFKSTDWDMVVDEINATWMNENCKEYEHGMGISIRHDSNNNIIRLNEVHDLGNKGITLDGSHGNNVTQNYVYHITDTFDYYPWYDNEPNGIQLINATNTYIGYNSILKNKRYGLMLEDSHNTTIEYNELNMNNYWSNNSHANFYLYNSTGIEFHYNTLTTDGNEWPWLGWWLEGNYTGHAIIEDTIWNRNENTTWVYPECNESVPDSGNASFCLAITTFEDCELEEVCNWTEGYDIPSRFSNLDLLTPGIAAVNASNNYFGSVDPNECTPPYDDCNRYAIPERMEEWEDWHGWGKVYFDQYLFDAVDIYCQQDDDGDGYRTEQWDMYDYFEDSHYDWGWDWDETYQDNFRCKSRSPYNTQRDCVDVPSDCNLTFEGLNGISFNYNNWWNISSGGTVYNFPLGPNPYETCIANTDQIYPGANEIACNGVDDDCDGVVDESVLFKYQTVCYFNEGDLYGDIYWADSCGNPMINSSPLFLQGFYPLQDTEPVEICGEPEDPMTNGRPWGENYCMNSSVYRNKLWYEKGCDLDTQGIPYCRSNEETYAELLEVCGNGCYLGECIVSCSDDVDNDGFISKTCGGTDCNDNNNSINPNASEICGDMIDNDCDSIRDPIYEWNLDGLSTAVSMCEDNAIIHLKTENATEDNPLGEITGNADSTFIQNELPKYCTVVTDHYGRTAFNVENDDQNCRGDVDIDLSQFIEDEFTIQVSLWPGYTRSGQTKQSLISYQYDDDSKDLFEIWYNTSSEKWVVTYSFNSTDEKEFVIDEYYELDRERFDWQQLSLSYDGNNLNFYLFGLFRSAPDETDEWRYINFTIPESGNLNVKKGILHIANNDESSDEHFEAGYSKIKIYNYSKTVEELENYFYDEWHIYQHFKMPDSYYRRYDVYIPVNLTKGWNQMSVPVCPTAIWNFSEYDDKCEKVYDGDFNGMDMYFSKAQLSGTFTDYLDKIDSIWYWNDTSGEYVPVYLEGELDLLDISVNVLDGFFVEAKENFTMTGRHYDLQNNDQNALLKTLHPGWNMVGFPATYEMVSEYSYDDADEIRWNNWWNMSTYDGQIFDDTAYYKYALNYTHAAAYGDGEYEVYPDIFQYEDDMKYGTSLDEFELGEAIWIYSRDSAIIRYNFDRGTATVGLIKDLRYVA